MRPFHSSLLFVLLTACPPGATEGSQYCPGCCTDLMSAFRQSTRTVALQDSDASCILDQQCRFEGVVSSTGGGAGSGGGGQQGQQEAVEAWGRRDTSRWKWRRRNSHPNLLRESHRSRRCLRDSFADVTTAADAAERAAGQVCNLGRCTLPENCVQVGGCAPGFFEPTTSSVSWRLPHPFRMSFGHNAALARLCPAACMRTGLPVEQQP